jgi:DNA (cytosine-5)-methyltransferase 1
MDNKATALRYIDLFAGCGGLSLGLMRSGWTGLFAVEKDAFAFSTLQANLLERKKHFQWPTWFPIGAHNIDEVLSNYKARLTKLASQVNLIVGGPPCQGFSVNGKRNEKDKRNRLVDSYVSFVALVKPQLLFFENVRGFAMEFSKNGSGIVYSDQVTRRLAKLGYDIHAEMVNFADYGIPQRRWRFILVGTSKGEAKKFFEGLKQGKGIFLESKGLTSGATVSQAISDLERRHGDTDCPDSKRFRSGLYSPPTNQYQRLMRGDSVRNIPDSHRFPNHRPEIVGRFKEILERAPRNKKLSGDLRSEYELKKRSITPLAADLVCPTITSLPDDYIHYTELVFARLLRQCRITGWRRHLPLPGTPDFVFPKQRVVLFVDGCFWHGCQLHSRHVNKSGRFWTQKIQGNRSRDRRVNRMLRMRGWRVLRVWEHDLNGNRKMRLIERLRDELSRSLHTTKCVRSDIAS